MPPASEDAAPKNSREQFKQLRDAAHLMVELGYTADEAMRMFRRLFLCEALEANHGNQLQTAKAIEMHRNTLARWLEELKIDPEKIRAPFVKSKQHRRPPTPRHLA